MAAVDFETSRCRSCRHFSASARSLTPPGERESLSAVKTASTTLSNGPSCRKRRKSPTVAHATPASNSATICRDGIHLAGTESTRDASSSRFLSGLPADALAFGRGAALAFQAGSLCWELPCTFFGSTWVLSSKIFASMSLFHSGLAAGGCLGIRFGRGREGGSGASWPTACGGSEAKGVSSTEGRCLLSAEIEGRRLLLSAVDGPHGISGFDSKVALGSTGLEFRLPIRPGASAPAFELSWLELLGLYLSSRRCGRAFSCNGSSLLTLVGASRSRA